MSGMSQLLGDKGVDDKIRFSVSFSVDHLGVHTCLLAFHWYIWKDILVFWDFWFIVEQVHAYGIVIWSMGQFLLPAGGAGSILSGYVLVIQSIS